MENVNKHYQTSDLYLQAFLRLMSPSSFSGVSKSNPRKVVFQFQNSKEIKELVDGYLKGEKFNISPQGLTTNINLGKALIFDDYAE